MSRDSRDVPKSNIRSGSKIGPNSVLCYGVFSALIKQVPELLRSCMMNISVEEIPHEPGCGGGCHTWQPGVSLKMACKKWSDRILGLHVVFLSPGSLQCENPPQKMGKIHKNPLPSPTPLIEEKLPNNYTFRKIVASLSPTIGAISGQFSPFRGSDRGERRRINCLSRTQHEGLAVSALGTLTRGRG